MDVVIVALYNYNGQGLDSWIDHGAGMTYTAAKEAGHDIGFIDMKALSNDEEMKEAIKGYDLIAISMKSSYYSIGMRVVEMAKAQGSKVMIGGYHVTAAPWELLENSDIDYIFHGESEITFPKFLDDPSAFEREIFGERPKNLDSLPFLDRSIYNSPLENCDGWWYGGKKKMTSVASARGCPYKCAFCQPLENNHFGKALRRRSVDSVIKELLQLKWMYNPDCVMIHDDTFLLQTKWLEEFIEKYPAVGLPFWAAGRADGICKNPDLVEKLVKVGWDLISVGFESGSQRILDKLKKGITVEQNLEAAKIIRNAGAKIYGNYITGIPWETKWDIQQTVKMADEIAAEMPSWAYFTPYPGCELGEELIERGWSLLEKGTYNRCPSGEKVKYVDYDYVAKVRNGLREETYPEFTDIIIPTYNKEDFTINCLNSIKEHTKTGSYNIIWIDNGSDDTSKVDEVIADMEHIAIRLPENLGFVGAINKGLEVSKAPNVCLLNNDTIVTKGWLKKLLRTLHSSDDIGIVGPMTNFGEGLQMDSHHSLSLHDTLLPSEAFDWNVDKVNAELEMLYPGKTSSVAFVAFLCAVIKREVIDKVGYLDENYEMGMWDDLDYNRSIWEFGYKSLLAVDTCIEHFGRTTFKEIQEKEDFNVGKLLKLNKGYLDEKWRKIYADKSRGMIEDPNRVIVISRAIYDDFGDEVKIGMLTRKRLDLMQRYFINSLKNQTDSDFTIYLVLGKYESLITRKIEGLDWEGLNIQFIYTDGDLRFWKQEVLRTNNWGHENFGSPEDIVRKCGHPKSNIMARLDTDDWVAPGWIAHMKYFAEHVKESHFLINYQVIGQDKDGRLYKFFKPHDRGRTSPFMALVQREDPRLSPYDDAHLKMGKKFSYVYNIPPGYAFMVIHDENRSNRMYQLDEYIGNIDCLDERSEKPKPKEVVNKKVRYPLRDSWRERIANAT